LALTSYMTTDWSLFAGVEFSGAHAAADPSIIRDGDIWRMYYTDGQNDGITIRPIIAEAISTDGIHWTPIGGNGTTGIVLTGDGAESANLETAGVFRVGSTYVLLYSGYPDTGAPASGFPAALYAAVSTDGVNFTTVSPDPVLAPTPGWFDNDAVYSPSVLQVNGGYVMIYCGHNYEDAFGIGGVGGVSLLAATSTDGLSWTKVAQPVLRADPAIAWMSDGVAEASMIIGPDGNYYLFFTGLQGDERSIGIAVAADPLGPWEVAPDPIISAASAGLPPGTEVIAPHAELVDGVLRLWYTVRTLDGVHSITYAEADWGGLVRAGVPSVPEWLGSGLDDIIVGGLVGDVVAAMGGNDLILTDGGPDTIDAGDGNDEIWAGDGDDSVLAGAGDDVVDGAAGRDTIDGGDGNDVVGGGGDADQILGGLGHDTLDGGDGDDTLDGGDGDDHVWGSDGNDSLLGGAGRDTLHGGSGDNRIDGGDGDDILLGGIDDDLILGGAGNDIIDGGGGRDTIDAGDGDDEVWAGEGADSVLGSLGNDTLHGGADDNTMDGGEGRDLVAGGVGADVLLGGAGNDTLFGDEGNDLIDGGSDDDQVWAGEGDDTVLGGAGHDEIYGGGGRDSLDGGDGNDLVAGDADADTLLGGAGDDTVFGGDGANSLDGGAGADLVIGGIAADTIAGGEGADTLEGADGFDFADFGRSIGVAVALDGSILATGDAAGDLLVGFEGLIGSATGADRLVGDGGANRLVGQGGDDTLEGGAGADTLEGGVGDDTYVVGAGDVVIEGANAGVDGVITALSYTLGANLETLVAASAVSAALTLTGNALSNTITGGAGADLLNGGAGADTLSGGLGNDTYVVDAAGDLVIEAANAGVDTVRSSVSFTLSNNLENLVATAGVSAALTLTGNTLNNRITGGGGADMLRGAAGNDIITGGSGADTIAGGTGNDRLTGGTGTDAFLFDTLPNATTNLDRVVDFSVVDDVILLDNAVMAGLGVANGTLAAAAFRTAAGAVAAADATDRIIYNTTTGDLYYDADGLGGAGAIRIAVIENRAALTAADFQIV